MAVAGTVLNPFSNPLSISNSKSNPRIKTLRTLTTKQLYNINSSPLSTTIFFSPHFKTKFQVKSLSTHFSPKASSSTVGNPDYIVEPTTDVKFQKSLTLPGCQNPLVFLGSGFREKVFAIIGVKVYGAGFYANQSVIEILKESRSKSPNEIQGDSSLYDSIYQAPMEKSLQIVLVRDVDGKTFWNALDEAVSPRIQSPTPVDESALSTFRGIFDGRSLKKGTLIFLTWLNPSKMLICISSNGLPSTVDATIESQNVTFALFDVFFGDTPVSPTLKASVSNGLAMILN